MEAALPIVDTPLIHLVTEVVTTEVAGTILVVRQFIVVVALRSTAEVFIAEVSTVEAAIAEVSIAGAVVSEVGDKQCPPQVAEGLFRKIRLSAADREAA
jgi:hypothetical protein